jgi:hypothetical protein
MREGRTEFTLWLRQEMAWQDLTRLEVAARGGFDPFDVVAWMEERSVPTVVEAVRLARLFEVPVSIVMRLTGRAGSED